MIALKIAWANMLEFRLGLRNALSVPPLQVVSPNDLTRAAVLVFAAFVLADNSLGEPLLDPLPSGACLLLPISACLLRRGAAVP
ncbi:hypothetical protein GGR56DRAFT_521178 [Xylariaceae sp. FL0804]|nr:hypothetical protein GGR56DRAFT_521178 [Xylariaceae sp. FL0804]